MPIKANLLYTPGALLRNALGNIPADWDEVTIKGEIDFIGYYQLYKRRLLPALLYANTAAGLNNRMALITVRWLYSFGY